MSLLTLTFENPEHGRLPVKLVAGSSVVEFVASDVPDNPLQDLVDALYASSAGLSARVWWHLEPGGYYFDFSTTGNITELSVKFSENSDEERLVDILTISGSGKEVLLPIWRFLRQYETVNVEEPHWPVVNYGNFEEIKNILRAANEA